MSKILQSIEIDENTKRPEINLEILNKIKLLLKLTRLVTENTKIEIEESENQQKQFFKLIQSFVEKIQNKLYYLSTSILKNRNLIENTK
jgi:hypothetical protein